MCGIYQVLCYRAVHAGQTDCQTRRNTEACGDWSYVNACIDRCISGHCYLFYSSNVL